MSELESRAERWAASTPIAAQCAVVPGRSMIGGGSLPEESLETRILALSVVDPDRTAAWLRRRERPIVGRIEEGRLLLDPRTVQPREDDAVCAALAKIA